MPHSAEIEKIKEEFDQVSQEANSFAVNSYRATCDKIMKPYSYEAAMINFGTKAALKSKELFKLQEEVEALENKDSATLKR